MASFLQVLEVLRPYYVIGKVPVLSYLYGPNAAPIRAKMVAVIDGELTVFKSDKRVGWTKFRERMLQLAGITDATCIADGDHKFEDAVKRVWAINEETRVAPPTPLERSAMYTLTELKTKFVELDCNEEKLNALIFTAIQNNLLDLYTFIEYQQSTQSVEAVNNF